MCLGQDRKERSVSYGGLYIYIFCNEGPQASTRRMESPHPTPLMHTRHDRMSTHTCPHGWVPTVIARWGAQKRRTGQGSCAHGITSGRRTIMPARCGYHRERQATLSRERRTSGGHGAGTRQERWRDNVRRSGAGRTAPTADTKGTGPPHL